MASSRNAIYIFQSCAVPWDFRKGTINEANNLLLDAVLGLLQHDEFRYRTLLEAHELVVVWSQLTPRSEDVAIRLSELLVNVVEHGNLTFDYGETSTLLAEWRWNNAVANRFVRVEVRREASQIILLINDQGQGFDYEKYLNFDPERAMDLHGRGIAMSRSESGNPYLQN